MCMDSKNSSIALFCIIFGVIIFSLFALNINKIKSVLEETHFIESVFGKEIADSAETGSSDYTEQTEHIEFATREKELEELEQSIIDTPLSQQLLPLDTTNTMDITSVTETTGNEETEISEIVAPTDDDALINAAINASIAANAQIESEKTEQEEQAASNIEMTNALLCFMTIDSAGNLIRNEVTRSIPANSSPLTSSINALLAGTNQAETDKGYLSLIPQNTTLLSASVKNKVAYLNFSDEFQWNKYGVEGYFGQLIQIVYTATNFKTVDSVQFLIEGQKQDYLGSEGVWIGTPLSRSSFK